MKNPLLITDQEVHKINDSIGKEAFERLSSLPKDLLLKLQAALALGDVTFHVNGQLGLSVLSPVRNGKATWSQEDWNTRV